MAISIPHPIPYQGSKRRLASHILQYIPSDTVRLIEPFAGSGAVSIAAAANGNASQFVLNDANQALITLWDAILNAPDKLADRYEILWNSQLGKERIYYDQVRERFNKTHRPYYFLYLLARCVKAAVRYNANGEFNQSPDNRRKGKRPVTMRKEILGAAALLAGRTQLCAMDYRQLFETVQPGDVVYMDPPYQGVCATQDPRYIMPVEHDEFVKALQRLNERDIAYIVSYDGRTGEKTFGSPLPDSLNLRHIELDAGRSSQATLLGRKDRTIESLYLSAGLVKRLGEQKSEPENEPIQYELDLNYAG